MSQLILHALSGEIEPLVGFYEFKRKITTEGEFTISFLIDRTDRNAVGFDLLQNKNKIELDGNLFVIDDVEREPNGYVVTKEVTANHEMFDRLKAQTVNRNYTAQKPLKDWLDIVLAGTGLTYEVIGDFGSQQFEDFGMDSSLDLFKNIISQYELEYRVFGTHLVIAQMIGNITEAQFRHGHNLKTFSDEFSTDNLVTEVTMYGKNDENGDPTVSVIVRSSNCDKYERPYKLVKQDERYTDEASLTEYAKTFLSDGDYSAKVEYEELEKNGLKLHTFDVGDYIWVIYDLGGIDLDIQARIMSVEDYPFNPGQSPVVELGSFKRDVTKKIAGLQNVNSKVAKLSQDTAKANQAVEEAKQAIAASGQTFEAHINDNVRHITDAERQKWNQRASYSLASFTNDGLMSKSDYAKLYGISKSVTSENPDFNFYDFGVYIAYAFQQIDKEQAQGSAVGNGYYYLCNLLEKVARKIDNHEIRITTLEGGAAQ